MQRLITEESVTARRPRAKDIEREFVRGNRDGPGGASQTYTVCRLRVAQDRLDREMKAGLHSNFVSLSPCWSCPAHMFLRAEEKCRQRQQATKRGADQLGYSAPRVASFESWRASQTGSRPAQGLEIIQKDSDRSGDRSTYTVCRLGVPRERMVGEVAEGLHPGYHLRRRRAGSSGRADGFFVQGNPTKPFDNVDYPKSRQAEPGFGPRELCPFRLLRAGGTAWTG